MMNEKPSTDWEFFASGLLVCVLTICVFYAILRLWPRAHYPRLFAALGSIAAVSAMHIFNVPGAVFGLGVLVAIFIVVMHAPDALTYLLEETPPKKVLSAAQIESNSRSTFGAFFGGALVGLLLSLLAVSALIIPPGVLLRWVQHSESIADRVNLALNPGEEWVLLKNSERMANQNLKRLRAELDQATRKLTDAERALEKAQDELGSMTSNTVRGIKVREKSASRHANGSIYIGVVSANLSSCVVRVSSDKADIEERVGPGKSIAIKTSKGQYRVVLTRADSYSECVFDLVKD
jgi:hypothetical protein